MCRVKSTMSKNILKGTVFFMFFSVLMLAAMSIDAHAIAFADMEDSPSVVLAGDDDIEGYMRRQGDTLRAEIFLETDSEPMLEQVKLGETSVSGCEELEFTDHYKCWAEGSRDYRSYEDPDAIPVRIYDDPQSDPVDEQQHTFSFDDDAPELSGVSVDGGSGAINVRMKVSDPDTGIKRIRIYRGSVEEGVLLDEKTFDIDDETGTYPNEFDDHVDDPWEITSNVPDGDHAISISVVDAFDNEEVSVGHDVNVFSEEPQLHDWKLSPCSHYDEDFELDTIGLDPVEICVYVLVDRRPTSRWDLSGELTNFDRSSDYKDDGREVEIDSFSCTSHDDKYVCPVSHYSDGQQISIKGVETGAHAYTANFEFTDDFGNTGTIEGTRSVDVIADMPVPDELYSLEEYDGEQYVAKDVARMRLDFDAGAKIDEERAILNANDIGGSTSVKATECTDDHCTWIFTPTGDSFSGGEVGLRELVDIHGNSAEEFSRVVASVTLNDNIPVLGEVTVQSSEHADEEDTNWYKECTSDDGVDCSECQGSSMPGDCDSLDFWDDRNDYFMEDRELDITLNLTGPISPEVTLEVGDTGEGGDANFTLDCTEEDDSYLCTQTGIPTPLDDHFIVHVEDIGGSKNSYHFPFETYERGGEGNIWSPVDVLDKAPEKINRKFMSISQIWQNLVVDFTPTQGAAQLQRVDVDCKIMSEEEGDLGAVDYANGFIGDNNRFFMKVFFRETSSIENEYLDEGKADLNCTFEAVGSKNGVVYTQEINMSEEIEFYESAFGTPGETIEKEIDDVMDA
ncbi:MAG: hypothetical protein ACLFSL_03315, partial [Candidatus Woesearchaeota archaeon]